MTTLMCVRTLIPWHRGKCITCSNAVFGLWLHTSSRNKIDDPETASLNCLKALPPWIHVEFKHITGRNSIKIVVHAQSYLQHFPSPQLYSGPFYLCMHVLKSSSLSMLRSEERFLVNGHYMHKNSSWIPGAKEMSPLLSIQLMCHCLIQQGWH